MKTRNVTGAIIVIALLIASSLSPVFGFGVFADTDESPDQTVVTVPPKMVGVISTNVSLIAYSEGETMEILSGDEGGVDNYYWLQHEDEARNDFCWFQTDHAEEKGWTLTDVRPLPDWEPCDTTSTTSVADTTVEATSSDVVGCTAWTEQWDPANGDWYLSNQGPMIVHFWSNRTSDQAVYKLYLGGGDFTLPGGGTVYLYPDGCGEQASVEYHATQFPAITLDQVMSLSGIVPGGNGSEGGNNGGITPDRNCTAEGFVHEPIQGEPWNVSNDGPLVVNVYNPFGSDTETYKVLLEPGSYTFPAGSGGDVSLYPPNCGDAAGAGYDNNSNASAQWDYLMTLGSGGQNNGGGEPILDCSETSTESFSSTPGTWWNFGHDGPMVVNFWSNWGQDQTSFKFLLEPGSYSMPGGGDVTKFPVGCGDAAGGAFDANPNPAGSWDYVQSFGVSPTAVPTEEFVPTSEPTAPVAPTQVPVQPTAEPTTVPPTETPTKAPIEPLTVQNEGETPPIVPEATPEG